MEYPLDPDDPSYALEHRAALDKALGGINLRDWYARIKDRVFDLAPAYKYSPDKILKALAAEASDEDTALIEALDPFVRNMLESMIGVAVNPGAIFLWRGRHHRALRGGAGRRSSLL